MKGKVDNQWLADPQIFAVNRLEAHSDHRYYANEGEMRLQETSFRYSLNGLWKFSYASNLENRPEGFEEETYDCKTWTDIRVPGSIELQGYGVPQYANVQYPWEGAAAIVPGEIPTEFNPTASYVKYFTVPAHMQGKPLFISFQGVESAFALWLNGAFVGYGEDSYTPSEFDLTPYVKDGENKLAVQVYRFSSGSWLEDQDCFRFSGIFREVYLYTIPEVHIYDMTVRAGLTDDYRNGLFSFSCRLKKNEDKKAVLHLCLARENKTVYEETLYAQTEASCQTELADVVQWSAEKPELYDLTVTVSKEDGTVSEFVSQKVGFRRFELKDGLMLFNGKRIVFKGVNRHDLSCDHGRSVTLEELRTDLINMKRHNINAIRTSHYPNQTALYELCDEYGFYLIDETNLETHGTWGHSENRYALPKDREEWLAAVLDRAASMYERDKNHACIIIWSCGNESFGGKDIFLMSEYFRKKDPTRLVHYEGICHDRSYPATSDMESQMYPKVWDIEKFLREHPEKPFICCEYTHAMGNSNGGMHKYTELADREPRYQGGFIWDYVDQAIRKKDRYGKEYLAYGGDLDDRPNDGNFCGDGIVFADRTNTPKLQEVKFNYQNISVYPEKTTAKICNKSLFTNTAEYTCVVTVERGGVLIERAECEYEVAPLSEKTVELPVREWTENGEYAVTVAFVLKKAANYAPAGHEVAFGQSVYRVEQAKEAATGTLELIDCQNNVGVKGENFHLIFSRGEGLISYRYAGREFMPYAPKPNFWRASTDNDRGNKMAFRYAQWKLASLYAQCREMKAALKDGEVVVSYRYVFPTVPESEARITYTVERDGKVRAALDCTPAEGLSDMPEFTLLFRLPADYAQVTFYGYGPLENYCDRNKGARLGLYQYEVSQNMTPYLMPQECGGRTGVRYAKVTDRTGCGMVFESVEKNGMDFSALPYTPHEIEQAAHAFELPQVHYTNVRVGSMMGVGGDDSWGAPIHDEYLVDASKPLHFECRFYPTV